MKIVAFSNLYPPLFIGGYEIGASQILQEMRRRGHEVLVLSAHEYFMQQSAGYLHRQRPCPGRGEEKGERVLDVGLCVFGSFTGLMRRMPLGFLARVANTWRARRAYVQALHDFKPDALLAFNPLGIVAPVLDDFVAYSRATGAPVYAYVSDHWVASWPAGNPVYPLLWRCKNSRRRWVRVGGRLLRQGLLRTGWLAEEQPLLDGYFYCSDFIRRLSREKSVGVADHQVAHWGLPDVEKLPVVGPDHFNASEPLTLLFAGQLLDHKGLKVLLRALVRTQREHRLVVIGDDATDYAAQCKALAGKLGLGDRVLFVGRKRHDEMLHLMAHTGQVLVVPSTWEEPFSIVVLEGMGLGLPVLASQTGGTAEGIEDGENGFLFPNKDSATLARLIDHLEKDRGLCKRVGARARQDVRERYTMSGLVDRLLEQIQGAGSGALRRAA